MGVAGPAAGYVLAQLAVLRLLEWLSPRFFVGEPTRLSWFSDVQAQFLPVMWWMGRNEHGLVPPLVDPDVGGNGNFTADMQYGALDPLHWLLLHFMSHATDFVLFSWLFAAATLSASGLAVFALLRQSGVPGRLAVPAALGAATSSFLMFFGSDWWPVLWTAPFFLWGWYGLVRRDAFGALIAGVCTWGLINGGNIYMVPFGGVLVATVVVLEVRSRGSLGAAFRQPWLRGSLLAMLGGACAAAPTLLTALNMRTFAGRTQEPSLVGNTGFGVPNLADVLAGGASMHAIANDWLGVVQQTPAFATFVVAVPALALVDWRRAVRVPVVITALVLCIAAAAATQLPAVFGPLRIPFRFVLVLELALPILVVVALCCAPQLTRRRIGLGATIVLIQGALAWSRTPALAGWHLLATAVAGVALAAVIITSAPAQQRARRGVAAGVLLCAAASQIFIGYGQLVDLYGRIQAGYPTQIRFQGDGYFLGTTPQDFRNRALATDTAVTVLQYDTFDVPPSERDAAGVLYGDANLLAGLRTGSGYAAFVHTGTRYLECHGPQKDEDICPNLLLPAPDTAPGVTWLDVMAADSVYLSPATPPDVIQHLDSSPLWRADGTDRGYRTYVRRTPLTGRITWSEGVSVATAGAVSSFARLGGDEERYTVSTEAGGGRVVLRVPYWPGYRASVDGRPVQVSPLGGAFVQISLPAGLQHAGLTVEYAPLGVRLFWPLVGVGLLLVIAGSVLAHRRRRGGPPETRARPEATVTGHSTDHESGPPTIIRATVLRPVPVATRRYGAHSGAGRAGP